MNNKPIDNIWKLLKLIDLVEYRKEFAFKSNEYQSIGHPIIRVTNFTDSSINMKDCNYLHPDKVKDYELYCLNFGDVVIATVGSWPANPESVVGKVIRVPKEAHRALLNQNAVRLRSNRNIEQRFLFYRLKNFDFQNYIISTAQGSANQASITLKSIFDFQFNLPPLSEQKAIAHILSSLDDKIELNRQMNETLEAMARAIFKSWFVDFDPVRAKMEGRQPAGMDAATADLFPDEFEESSLGLIPKEWKVKKLGDLAQNISRKFNFSNKTEVIFINTGDVLLGRFLHSNRISKEGLPGQAKKSICENDILMSEIRPANGRYAYVDFDSSDYVVSTKFMVIHALDEIEPRLLYRILILPVTLTELQVVAESRSGTFPQITFDSIDYLPIILPPKTIQLAFLRIVSLLEEQIKVNDLQSNTLVTIRDTLLPKLMSGEIRVKEAEKIMEKLT